jgi:2,4-dienoyl-CoA reductase-like NADH-dependent reductase (Old Yellow Enzyme family)
MKHSVNISTTENHNYLTAFPEVNMMNEASPPNLSDNTKLSKDPLLQPLKIKGLTIKNRIISTSHAISYAVDGKPKERYQLYQEEKARGGIGLTMFGGASNVAPDSPSVFGQIYAGDDSIIPYFQEMAGRIHRHGAAAMCQLTHMGRRTSNLVGNWVPTIAPSYIREDMNRAFAREMDINDINRVVKAFGDAAWRCKEGGLDGCEVIATGHLLDQFWSPRTNRRSDDFNGSLVNRTRFSRMVYEEMRKRTGDSFILSLRMVMEEDSSDGLQMEDCLEIARLHEQEGTLDVLNLVHGHLDSYQGLAQYMPGMAMPIAPFLEKTRAFRNATGLPIIHATRVLDIGTARYAVAEGLIDLVGMTRAHIADPHIVNKVIAGQEDRIRPCVGATYCSTHRQCIHNVSTGREAELPHDLMPAQNPGKKVVVIGGGPAGMEAARVAAERGHTVVLFEALGCLGGQILLAGRAKGRSDLLGISDWLKSELEILNVDIRYNVFAQAHDVLEENPDTVIVATGGIPNMEGYPGHQLANSTWDLLSSGTPPSGTILIFDTTGKNQAASCAQKLLETDVTLEIASPDSLIAQEVSKIERPFYLQRFYEKNVKMLPDNAMVCAEKHENRIRVTLRNRLTGSQQERIVDQLIFENGTLPNDEVFIELRPQSVNDGVTDLDALLSGSPQPAKDKEGFALYRIGDAVSSRDIHTAILDASRLCRTI